MPAPSQEGGIKGLVHFASMTCSVSKKVGVNINLTRGGGGGSSLKWLLSFFCERD